MAFSLFKRPAAPPPPSEACEPVSDLGLAPQAAAPYARGPRAAALLSRALAPCERLFDRLLGPGLNPVYRSGTLAFLFIALATASGLYLLLFYRLSDPYGSVLRLQQEAWGGRWLRAWHRYCADAAVVATADHLLRMLAEGKAWGARALAWISGVILLGMLGLCAWTGFVLVWDGQALALARAGARVADLLPVFAEPLSRAFHGAAQPPPSFFFMNLFLHVAAPLGILFGLWVHTARLSRSAWLPERKGLWLWGAALLAVALVWPVLLGDKADPLALGWAFPLDPFYNGWLPASLEHAAWLSLAAGLAAAALLLILPWTWKPAAPLTPPPSHNDEARCQCCVTCVHDCPFEAISMVPREGGQGSALVARVDPALCVSCGLCVASCDRLSIGPPDRIGGRQMAAAQALGRAAGRRAVVLISCEGGSLAEGLRRRAAAEGLDLVPWALDCAGSLHPFTVHALQQRFSGVVVATCAPAACRMRHGAELAAKRFLDKQEPADKTELDDARLRLIQRADAEEAEAWVELRAFAESLGLLAPTVPAPPRRRRAALALGAMLPWALALAGLAALRTGKTGEGSALRLAWRLPGQAVRDCRDLSAEELAARPAHMRRKTECVTRRLSYALGLDLDGTRVLERVVAPKGVHGDAPLNVDLELPVLPGLHRLALHFVPADVDGGQGRRLSLSAQVRLEPGRVLLVSLDEDGKALELLPKQP